MIFQPILPAGDLMGQSRQQFLKIPALNALEIIALGKPQAAAFLIVEDKELLIRPARRGQGQGLTFDAAAVHGRQVRQGSVGCGDGDAAHLAVDNFVAG